MQAMERKAQQHLFGGGWVRDGWGDRLGGAKGGRTLSSTVVEALCGRGHFGGMEARSKYDLVFT